VKDPLADSTATSKACARGRLHALNGPVLARVLVELEARRRS
jgi:hypothetical protein